MPSATPQQEKVKSHYRDLAAEYGARANGTCEKTYRTLVRRFLAGRRSVLELGAGCSDLLEQVDSPFAVAVDLSLDMLRMRRPRAAVHCLACAGERLPFRDASFDGLFHVNVLEHVSDVDAVVKECARVLQPGGLWLAITPNGNWEFWLDLAERWRLKIPEGPHAFLTTARLRQAAEKHFAVLEHRTLLTLPAGPPALARWVDRLTCCTLFKWGFFQYLVGRKR